LTIKSKSANLKRKGGKMRLNFFSESKSIAFIGISNQTKQKRILENLLNNGYLGRIFIVNKNHQKIANFISYSNVLEIPSHVDTALVFNPISEIPQILKDCQMKKISKIYLFSDFKENNFSEIETKKEIIKLSLELNLSVFGPKISKIIDLDKKIYLSDKNYKLAYGKIGLITFDNQSLELVIDNFLEENLGLSYCLNLGLDWLHQLETTLKFLTDNPTIKIIMLVLEKDTLTAEEFFLIQKISLIKPLIIYTPNHLLSKKLMTCQVILTDDFEEFITLGQLLSFYPNLKRRIFNTLTNSHFLSAILLKEIQKNHLVLAPEINSFRIISNYQEFQNYQILKNSLLYFQPFDNNQDLKNIFSKILENPENLFKENILLLLTNGVSMNQLKKILYQKRIPYFENPEILLKAIKKIINYKQNIEQIRSQSKLFFFKKKDKLFSN